MRKINKIFCLLAALSFAGFVSCTSNEEEFVPGEPDAANCEGVYFPKQSVIEETQVFDPTQEKTDTIIVRRTNSNGALTVKPVLSGSNGETDIFTVSDIVFEDGQEETKISVDFAGAKEGVQYKLGITVDGDANVSKYSSNSKTCDYSVMCVKYETFCEPDGETPARITFTQGWWGEVHTAYLKYYEVDGIRYCSTYDEKLVGTAPDDGGEDGFWGQDEDAHFEFEWYVAPLDECPVCGEEHSNEIPGGFDVPEGAQLIHFEPNFIFVNSGTEMYYYSYYCVTRDFRGYANPFLHFTCANEYYDQTSYYDGNGGFYFWPEYVLNSAGSGWSIGEYDMIGVASGYTRADHTLELSAGLTEAAADGTNVVPVTFKTGANVFKVGYTVLEGAASSAQVASEALAIEKDTVDFKYATYVYNDGASFTDNISAEATGVYTVVAVAFDTLAVSKTGDTTWVAKNNASVQFNYLLAGETNEVVLDVTAFNTEPYAARGYAPETNVGYSVKGAGITGAISMVFSQAEVESEGGINALVADLVSDPNYFYDNLEKYGFTAAQLSDVNGDGFTGFYGSGVTPGTTYYVLVWATNGYDTTIAYDTMLTSGDPLPIYQTYTDGSYDKTAELSDASKWYGTWNLYGIDFDEGGSLRSYLGKATIKASDTPTEGPDKYGFYDEYVVVNGLFGDLSWLNKYGINVDDSYEMDVYAGAMYTCTNTIGGDDDLTVYLYSKGQNVFGYDYADAYWTAFIPVGEGYYAFVDGQYGASYNFTGLGLYSQTNGWYARVYDQLLVDPAKDDNGVAPKAVNKMIAKAKADLNKSLYKVEELGYAGKKAVREALADYMHKFNAKQNLVTPVGMKGVKVSTAGKRVAAGHDINLKKSRKASRNDNIVPAQFSSKRVK